MIGVIPQPTQGYYCAFPDPRITADCHCSQLTILFHQTITVVSVAVCQLINRAIQIPISILRFFQRWYRDTQIFFTVMRATLLAGVHPARIRGWSEDLILIAGRLEDRNPNLGNPAPQVHAFIDRETLQRAAEAGHAEALQLRQALVRECRSWADALSFWHTIAMCAAFFRRCAEQPPTTLAPVVAITDGSTPYTQTMENGQIRDELLRGRVAEIQTALRELMQLQSLDPTRPNDGVDIPEDYDPITSPISYEVMHMPVYHPHFRGHWIDYTELRGIETNPLAPCPICRNPGFRANAVFVDISLQQQILVALQLLKRVAQREFTLDRLPLFEQLRAGHHDPLPLPQVAPAN